MMFCRLFIINVKAMLILYKNKLLHKNMLRLDKINFHNTRKEGTWKKQGHI